MSGGTGEEREGAGVGSIKARKAMERLNTLYENVLKQWPMPDRRVFGHVFYSPPIDLSPQTGDFTCMIHPNPTDAKSFAQCVRPPRSRVSFQELRCTS